MCAFVWILIWTINRKKKKKLLDNQGHFNLDLVLNDVKEVFLYIWREMLFPTNNLFCFTLRKNRFVSMKRDDLHPRWTNVYATERKRSGNINSTFTAMICPLGTCRIFSTTPYAPRPSSIIGSRSSAFTSKFCRRERSCTRKEEKKKCY